MLAVVRLLFLLGCLFGTVPSLSAQVPVDENQSGAWYMYFFTKSFDGSRFGVQGDLQYRSWDAGGDMEQLLIRGGATYRPQQADVLLTLGYATITTGEFGESDATVHENRVYQEALLPHRVTSRLRLVHRFRYEQRWVESQDLRTRYRYNLFVNILLNAEQFEKKAAYVALYNELFINGQRDIGDGGSVQFFDRNRTYLGVGYGLRDNLRTQVGMMRQTTVNWAKWQAQLSLHHSF